ncbi:MAG: hypothetical protein OET44_13050 [Gammaproteobacteria bacterium]|nr:hypothetical protein [Gammaproteobacteria bacterium]
MNKEGSTLQTLKGIGESRERVLNETLNVYEATDFLFYTPEEVQEELKDVKPKVSDAEIDRWYQQVQGLCEREYDSFELEPSGFSFTERPTMPGVAEEDEWTTFASFVVEYQAKTLNGKTQLRTNARHTEVGAEKRWWGAESVGPREWMNRYLSENVGTGIASQSAATPGGEILTEMVERKIEPREIAARSARLIRSSEASEDAGQSGREGNSATQEASSECAATHSQLAEVRLLQPQHGVEMCQSLSNGTVAGAPVLPGTPFELTINCEQGDFVDHAEASFKRVGTREQYEFQACAGRAKRELSFRIDALHPGTYSLFVKAGNCSNRKSMFLDIPMLLVA